MAVYKRDIVDINLETGNIHRSFLKHSIGYMDQKADHFGVRVFRNGEPVDLTGVSAQGVFMPPQGSPIAITSGNIVSGNVAEVVLPQACYNYDGQFTLAIKLVDSNNNVTGTVRIVDGMVDNTHASGTVAPTSAVPTYQEILSTYNAMIAATEAANGAIAATYSSSSTYAVGDYCIHDGGLYRCTTAITSGESWTSGHWTAAKLGPDISDLKSAFEGTRDKYIEKGKETITSFKQGTPTNPANLKRCNSGYFRCYPGDVIKVTGIASGQKFAVASTSGVDSGWQNADFNLLVLAESDYFVNVATSSGNDNISPSDIIVVINVEDGSSIINALSVAWTETENRYVPNFKAAKTGATNTAYYSISDGVISFTGGTATSSAIVISEVITLEAGTYYFGSFNALQSSKCGLQLRLWENNEDAGDVGIETVYSYRSFTISEQKTVVARLRLFGTSSMDGVQIRPMLVKNTWPLMFIPNKTAVDYSARFSLMNVWKMNWMNYTDGMTGDADTLLDPGLYRGGAAGTYTHIPDSAAGKSFIIEVLGQINSGNYRVQRLTIYGATYEIWIRQRTGGTPTWGNWAKVYDSSVMDIKSDNNIIRYTTDIFTGTTPNVGTKLRIMSYNVAKYNNDTATYISDEKRFNFKKMLSKISPDFIGVQEAREMIDGDSGTKPAMQYIYKPVLPFVRGANNYELISKQDATNGGIVRLTDENVVNRELRWATYAIGNKVLLFCTVHPIARHNGDITEPYDSEASIADRKVEYTKTMQWVCGDIDLAYYDSGYDSSRRRYAPTHDYCIITGDMNTCTEDDQDNLKEQVEEKNFTMANGGWLGWMWTNRDKAGTVFMALDNVICSSNIIINSVTAYQSMYSELYSDHVPFVADVTLL